MKKGIYLSIKPKFTRMIETGTKNYEFRKYYPKEEIDTLYVYETAPTCALKYIIELGNIIEYPDKIKEMGYGNEDFNKGLKKSKYAYKIKHVDLIENPISLNTLRDNFGFFAPQSYAYDARYEKLTNYIKSMKVKRLI
jgi:predicted transcriptional regulator